MIKLLSSKAVRLFWFGIASLISIGALASSATAVPTVAWNETTIKQTIGDGRVISDKEIQFRVSESLKNATVAVTPSLRSFITISPNIFPELRPGIVYFIKISFTLPARTPEGTYKGAVQLFANTRTISKPLAIQIMVAFGENVISPDVVTFSNETSAVFRRSLFVFGSLVAPSNIPEISEIQAGKLLVLPSCQNLPEGFIGRVTGTLTMNNEIFIATSPATIEEAFVNASISIEKRLTIDDVEQVTSVATIDGSHKGEVYARKTEIMDAGITFNIPDVVLYKRDANQFVASGQRDAGTGFEILLPN